MRFEIGGVDHDRFALGALGRAGGTRGEGRLCTGLALRPRPRIELQKKRLLPAEQLRPKIARRRAQWKKYQGRLDPACLVFIDEAWAKINMAPLRGWAPRDQRLHTKMPYGYWRIMTFIAALRCDRIDAPCVLDQPINGASFADWVEQFLIPTLAPDVIVSVDNLSSHKRATMRQAIRAAKVKLLYLPPYASDLTPIEKMFSKLKHLLRKASERTAEASWRNTGTLFNAFPPQECANYLANSSYASV